MRFKHFDIASEGSFNKDAVQLYCFNLPYHMTAKVYVEINNSI